MPQDKSKDVEKQMACQSRGVDGNIPSHSTPPQSNTTSSFSAPRLKSTYPADMAPLSKDEASIIQVPFPALRPTATSRSASRAAEQLVDFGKSPDNPRNWSNGKKWRVTVTVAMTGFISTLGSSINVPGVHAISAAFGVENEKIGILTTTFYVLGLGVGPFLFAPISELYGRQVSYLSSLFPYVLFTLACALSQNIETMIVCRFFCGVFGSVGPSLGVATVADIFAPEHRGKPISIYAVGPMAGPVMGNMVGYWILFGGWRWPLYAMTIIAAFNLTVFLCFMQETYAPAIEKKLKYQVKHPVSDPTSFLDRFSPRRIIHSLGWMGAMVSQADASAVFGKAFSRPPRLLFCNPICFVFCFYYAYLYGIIYVFLVSVPLLFGAPPYNRAGLFTYNWPQATLPLSYIALGFGFFLSTTIAANAQDRIYKYLSKRSGSKGQPEFRLVLTQIGMIIMPIGLFIFGWTAHAETHWMGPLVGMSLVALGLMLPFNSIQNFLVDAFFPYSGGAIGAATALRSVVACVLPEFSGDMFENLGWGWGGSLLAFVAILGAPAPMIMFKYGKGLRERFKFEG